MPKTHAELHQQFLQGQHGRELLKMYRPDSVEVWKIEGESTEMSTPHLGFVEGKLADVIDYAVGLDNFWSYGSGGRITALQVKKVDAESIAAERALKERRKQLQAELASIDQQLDEKLSRY